MANIATNRRNERFRESRPGSAWKSQGVSRQEAQQCRFLRERAVRIGADLNQRQQALQLECRIDRAMRIHNPLWRIDNYSALLDSFGAVRCSLNSVIDWHNMKVATYIGQWGQVTIRLICRLNHAECAPGVLSIDRAGGRTHIELTCNRVSLVFSHTAGVTRQPAPAEESLEIGKTA